jgi:AraC-like DNA-binding protein
MDDPCRMTSAGPLAAATVRIVRFSTDNFPKRQRIALWNETRRQQIVGLDLKSLVDRPRTASMGIVLPGLGVVTSAATPLVAGRTRQLLSDGNDNLRLVILRKSKGRAVAAQFGREITIDSGGAIVLSNSEQNSVAFLSPYQLISLNLRRGMLRPLLRDFDAVLARAIPKDVAPLRLLSIYVEGLIEQPALDVPDVTRLVVDQIYDLAALTMGATRDAAEIANGRGLRVARLRAIKVDIAERLTSPNLSVETVAMRQQVSPRYVQMLFEQEGTTFSQYVIGQRLVRAHRMLTDPRFADRSITSVAFEVLRRYAVRDSGRDGPLHRLVNKSLATAEGAEYAPMRALMGSFWTFGGKASRARASAVAGIGTKARRRCADQ